MKTQKTPPHPKSQLRSRDHGYVLLGVLIVVAVSMIITAGMLTSATGTLSTRKVMESNTKNFYSVERSINAVTAWLQSNSKNIVTAFNSTNFHNNFDLGDPTVGDNEGTAFAVPTLIKMKGSSNAVQLTNSSFFGTSAFPATTNIDSGASFNAATAFQGTDFGGDVSVRLLVVWATSTDGHYQPIFRVDAVTGQSGPEHGVHGINFIKSSLVASNGGVGYFASLGDFQTSTPNNECWSYQYTWNAATSTWSRGAARSNCLITGLDDIALKSAIHGSVMTNKTQGINLVGGSISGQRCEGAGCVSYTLPNYPNWAARCGSVPVRDVAGTAATLAITSGPTLAEQCYRNITIGANKSVKFTTPNQPYYIQNITPQNNSNSQVFFTTVGPSNKYTLYVDNFMGGQVNGNQLVATNLAPNQLEINLTLDGTLTLNGTAAMNGVFIGRENFTIKHNGNFPFYGAYRSGAVSVIGNAVLGYDEALGGLPVLSDINFTLFKASQRYR